MPTPGISPGYYRDVAAAYRNGLVSGYDATTFGPENTVTREQIAALYYSYEF